MNLLPLDKTLRSKLEQTVKEARDVAEQGARATVRQLEVGLAKVESLTNEEDKELRRRLRIHGRQLGDTRDPKNETQQVERLVEEIAYEHWHRMLFARFLAENHLLMYPDPDDPVSVSIDDCNDLAADEGAANGWELAARFAAKMLPQIFRVDSPVFAATLPPEKQQQLERLLSELPLEVFTASDSLGWVYQFWQAEAKKRINESEVKIGARELPAVTQLFTEPYMVSFLLDNSLGAWWAARRLTEEDFRTAESEQELREKAALPGVLLEYLRFVRSPSGDEGEGEENTGPWTPAAGSFDAWPESLSELKTLDPCCGSGHFLVAALLMLAPMRMELEGLSAREAVDLVLSENLHGLEIDQRCVELAAFALALTAWRFPGADGYRPLPDLNVACCGIAPNTSLAEWQQFAAKAVAKEDSKKIHRLSNGLDKLYEAFAQASVLGSLINPGLFSGDLIHASFVELRPLFEVILKTEAENDEIVEFAVAAKGMAEAASLMSSKYHLVITNVPYLGRRKQNSTLKTFCNENYSTAKLDLGACMVERCQEFCVEGGTSGVVTLQNSLFLSTYADFRSKWLNKSTWNVVCRLGAKGFQTPMYDFGVVLLVLTRRLPTKAGRFRGIDVGGAKSAEEKTCDLPNAKTYDVVQSQQAKNPDSAIVFEATGGSPLLERYADSYQGSGLADIVKYRHLFWELDSLGPDWVVHQSSPSGDVPFSGMHFATLWERGEGMLVAEPSVTIRGRRAWKKNGVACAWLGSLPASFYSGTLYDNSAAAIIPKSKAHLASLWCFMSSPDYLTAIRKINQKTQVANATLVKVPFDLAHWQQVASEKYPYGLPKPYSDDPTQWIFHGHPATSSDALQVAVARLLGYRWPAELDDQMELAEDARQWVNRSSQLTTLADNDGIVCIPAVGTEQPAEDRLLNLLHTAYEEGRAVEQQFQEKLEAGDTDDSLTVALLQREWQPELPGSFNDWVSKLLEAADHKGKTLGSWLREKFFTQHCKLFHHRPFIWHIWDGLRDGFSVLVNYHRLDNKLLKALIYTYLNDWITRQKQDKAASVDGSEEKLAAAQGLKERMELILEGEAPLDIFVRWKPLEEQPIGWNPDLNDGVRLNIRPWLTVGDVGKRGAGVLRDKPNIKWTKDRGKDVESAPWYHLGPEYKGKEGDRINDHHLTLAEKAAARREAE